MRIGIYGGTFSPPHAGHVAAARAFMEQMWLDVLFIVPAATPPHKAEDSILAAHHRFAMCERAFGGMEGVIVSDIELRRAGNSYTADTLREIAQASEPDSRLFLLMGTDMLLTLHRWYRPEEIFRLSYPVYMRREADDPILQAKIVAQIQSLSDQYGKVVRRITGDPLPLSGTTIRRICAQGGSIAGMVPPSVEQYIKDHNLYV